MTNRFLALLIDWRFQFVGTEIVRLIPSGQAERGGGGWVPEAEVSRLA